MSAPRRILLRLAGLCALVAVACSPAGPRPIAYGEATCDFCRMTVGDERFGSEFVTAHGKVMTFDSIECLAGYAAQVVASGTAGEAYVADFTHPGTLLHADKALFLRATTLHSPMGRGLVAVPTGTDITALIKSLGAGRPLSWSDVITLVQSQPVHA